VSEYVYVQAPLPVGAGLLPHALLYGTPWPRQVTLSPSVVHTTSSGTATTVAETSPAVTVVPMSWYAPGFRYRYVGRPTTAAEVSGGEVPTFGLTHPTCERAHSPSTLAAVGGVLRVPTAKRPATVGSGQKTTPIER
jgi:hypothetical protein